MAPRVLLTAAHCLEERRPGDLGVFFGPGRGGAAVLHGDGELVLGATHVERAIGPSVEVSRPSQSLPGLGASGTILAGVVDDEDGDVVLALQLAEKGEESGDVTSRQAPPVWNRFSRQYTATVQDAA